MNYVCKFCEWEYKSDSGLKRHISLKHGHSYAEYCKLFNIDKRLENKKAKEQEVIESFLQRIKDGKSVRYSDLKNEDSSLLYKIERRFGSVYELSEKLGVLDDVKKKFGVKTNNTLMTEEEILKNLEHLKSIGKLTTTNIRTYFENQSLQSAINKRFGCVENALIHFGLERDLFLWNEEKIKDEILKHKENGEDLSYKNMLEIDSRLLHSSVNHMKMGWRELLEYFKVEHTPKRRRFSKEFIISEINNLISDKFPINPTSIRVYDESLYLGIYEHFGTYEELYKAMNLNPNDYITYDNKQRLGFKFEKTVKQMFDELNIEHEYNKYVGNLRPDFILPNNNWIDVKLSSWTAFHDNTFDKYTPHCNSLIIIYLRGEHIQNVPNNSELRHISYYYDKLEEVGKEYFIDIFNNIEEESYVIEYE